VGMMLLGIFYLMKLKIMLVLPVPESPTRITKLREYILLNISPRLFNFYIIIVTNLNNLVNAEI